MTETHTHSGCNEGPIIIQVKCKLLREAFSHVAITAQRLFVHITTILLHLFLVAPFTNSCYPFPLPTIGSLLHLSSSRAFPTSLFMQSPHLSCGLPQDYQHIKFSNVSQNLVILKTMKTTKITGSTLIHGCLQFRILRKHYRNGSIQSTNPNEFMY